MINKIRRARERMRLRRQAELNHKSTEVKKQDTITSKQRGWIEKFLKGGKGG